jgi:hypothetical protein
MMKRLMFVLASFLAFAQIGRAQTMCRVYLVEQSDESRTGFGMDLEENNPPAGAPCNLQGMTLAMAAGSGTEINYIAGFQPAGGWMLNTEYTARAVYSPNGSSSLSLNGVLEGSADLNFVPYNYLYRGYYVPSWANYASAYTVVEEDLTIKSSTGRRLDTSFAEEDARPHPLWTYSMQGARRGIWKTNPGETLTVTAKFHLIATPPINNKIAYVDAYGQSNFAAPETPWPGKVTNDSDLAAAYAAEKTQLTTWGTPVFSNRKMSLKEAKG